jgi:hypothetical protein
MADQERPPEQPTELSTTSSDEGKRKRSASPLRSPGGEKRKRSTPPPPSSDELSSSSDSTTDKERVTGSTDTVPMNSMRTADTIPMKKSTKSPARAEEPPLVDLGLVRRRGIVDLVLHCEAKDLVSSLEKALRDVGMLVGRVSMHGDGGVSTRLVNASCSSAQEETSETHRWTPLTIIVFTPLMLTSQSALLQVADVALKAKLFGESKAKQDAPAKFWTPPLRQSLRFLPCYYGITAAQLNEFFDPLREDGREVPMFKPVRVDHEAWEKMVKHRGRLPGARPLWENALDVLHKREGYNKLPLERVLLAILNSFSGVHLWSNDMPTKPRFPSEHAFLADICATARDYVSFDQPLPFSVDQPPVICPKEKSFIPRDVIPKSGLSKQRWQEFAMPLKNWGLPPCSKISRAVDLLDPKALNIDSLDTLLRVIPTPEECVLLKRAGLVFREEDVLLGLTAIPLIFERLIAWRFLLGWDDGEIRAYINSIRDGIEQVRMSENLSIFLQHMDAMCRFAAPVAQATMEDTIKYTFPQCKLPVLILICEDLLQTTPHVLTFPEELKGIHDAARVSIQLLIARVQYEREQLESAKEAYNVITRKKALLAGESNNITFDRIAHEIDPALAYATSDIEALEEALRKLSDEYRWMESIHGLNRYVYSDSQALFKDLVKLVNKTRVVVSMLPKVSGPLDLSGTIAQYPGWALNEQAEPVVVISTTESVVTVLTLQGHQFNVDIDAHARVIDIHRWLADHAQIPIERQQLITCEGQELERHAVVGELGTVLLLVMVSVEDAITRWQTTWDALSSEVQPSVSSTEKINFKIALANGASYELPEYSSASRLRDIYRMIGTMDGCPAVDLQFISPDGSELLFGTSTVDQCSRVYGVDFRLRGDKWEPMTGLKVLVSDCEELLKEKRSGSSRQLGIPLETRVIEPVTAVQDTELAKLVVEIEGPILQDPFGTRRATKRPWGCETHGLATKTMVQPPESFPPFGPVATVGGLSTISAPSTDRLRLLPHAEDATRVSVERRKEITKPHVAFIAHHKAWLEAHVVADACHNLPDLFGKAPILSTSQHPKTTTLDTIETVAAISGARIVIMIVEPNLNERVAQEGRIAAHLGIPVITFFDADKYHRTEFKSLENDYPEFYRYPTKPVYSRFRQSSVSVVKEAILVALREGTGVPWILRKVIEKKDQDTVTHIRALHLRGTLVLPDVLLDEIAGACVVDQYKLDPMPGHSLCLAGGTDEQTATAARYFRDSLGHEKSEHRMHVRDSMLACGAVKSLVQALKRLSSSSDTRPIQYDVACALTNFCSGDAKHVQAVIEEGALPILVDLLSQQADNSSHDIREMVPWNLTNIAGESIDHRDEIVRLGCLGLAANIILMSEKKPSDDVCREVAGLFYALHRPKPLPPWNESKKCLPAIVKLLQTTTDVDTAQRSLWTLAEFALQPPPDAWPQLLEAPVLRTVARMLMVRDERVTIPAARVCGRYACGTPEQVAILLSPQYNILRHLRVMIGGSDKEKMESIWAVSNVLAEAPHKHVQAVVNERMIPALVIELGSGVQKIREESVCCIANLTRHGTDDHARLVAGQANVMANLCDMFVSVPENCLEMMPESYEAMISDALDVLIALLRVSELEKPAAARKNACAQAMQDRGCPVHLRNLHKRKGALGERAGRVVSYYFSGPNL